jgi:hypothetical protein
MENLTEITKKIKVLREARKILQKEYDKSDFHKKKVDNPQDIVPSSPKDKEIFKLLTAISQLDFYIKKLQKEQFKILKGND